MKTFGWGRGGGGGEGKWKDVRRDDQIWSKELKTIDWISFSSLILVFNLAEFYWNETRLVISIFSLVPYRIKRKPDVFSYSRKRRGNGALLFFRGGGEGEWRGQRGGMRKHWFLWEYFIVSMHHLQGYFAHFHNNIFIHNKLHSQYILDSMYLFFSKQ